MSTTDETPGNSLARTAWLAVALLVPVALLNYLDRQMLAAMKQSMMKDIPDIATRENWGIVLGSFKWVYAVLSPFGGYIADRVSRRHIICLSLFLWSAVTWWTGHVGDFQQLIVARAVMGVSEAFYIPAALALITDFHVGPTRSRAVGMHQMGIYAGIIIGGFTGYAANSDSSIGWRNAFTICGMVGIAYAFPLFLLLKNPPRSRAVGGEPKLLAALGSLAGNGGFRLMVLYFTIPAIAGWVVKDWMPDILQRRYELDEGDAAAAAVIFVQIASIVGAIVGGWQSDALMSRTPRGRIFVSALGMLLFLPALVGLGNAPTLAVAITCLVVYGLGWGFFDCNNMPILCQVVRPELRATGYGIMNFVSISVGGIADWLFGKLVDEHVPDSQIFGTFAALALLSVVVVLLIRPDPALGHDAGH